MTNGAPEDDPVALIEQGETLHVRGEYLGAVECFQRAVAMNADNVDALNRLGKSLNNLRRFDDAARAFQRCIELQPGFVEAHNNLGHVERARGKLSQAAVCFREAIKHAPGYALAHKNLGTIYQLQGKLGRAVSSLRHSLELAPEDPQGQASLGELLLQREQHEEAMHCYRAAVEMDPSLVEAWIGLGATLQHDERLDDALDSYRRAFELAPDNEAALYGLTSILELRGRYEEGLSLARSALKKGDLRDDVIVAYARLLRRVGQAADAITLIEPMVKSREAEGKSWPRLDYTMGDLHDEAGNHERAFLYYSRANNATRKDFDPVAHRRGVGAIIQYFTQAKLKALPRSSEKTDRPTFIVGMPRSGTTLVEQILAAHPAVHAGGELTRVFFLARDMSTIVASKHPYPDCLDEISPEILDRLASEYLRDFPGLAHRYERLTDKLPANFLNLGLIELLFPGARIIHCKRDRLDTCLSCFFQNFRSQSFSHDLIDIGVYYSQYRRMMRHWESVISLPILEVHYEELVQSQETQSRRLLEFLGLEWDPACLNFYQSDRIIKTTSYAQVRKPIYTSSIGRHRHYMPRLQPLVDALKTVEH